MESKEIGGSMDLTKRRPIQFPIIMDMEICVGNSAERPYKEGITIQLIGEIYWTTGCWYLR